MFGRVLSALKVGCVVFVLFGGGVALANTFACCLPDGSCEDLLLSQCQDRDGISFMSSLCSESTCAGVAAPAVSFPVLLLLVVGLLTLAIYTLMRRRSAADPAAR